MSSTGDLTSRVSCLIRASIAVKEILVQDPELVSIIAKVSELLIDAFRGKKKVILFGNGGSAADAQHIAAEFVGRFALDRAALPALALSVNTSCITAIGNDYGFDLVFARQIEALGQAGDVAIGISTSGNSANVIRACDEAARRGLLTVGLAGYNGGAMAEAASIAHLFVVPSSSVWSKVSASCKMPNSRLHTLLCLAVSRCPEPINWPPSSPT